MANMSYVRFENTLRDLRDCYEHMDATDLSDEEEQSRRALLKLCSQIADVGVLDLLATIHRDGGHHTEAVGVEQSVKDAMHLVDAWKVEP